MTSMITSSTTTHGAKPLGLRLTDVTATGSGVIVATYLPAGAPALRLVLRNGRTPAHW